jgi:hypothetical protein
VSTLRTAASAYVPQYHLLQYCYLVMTILKYPIQEKFPNTPRFQHRKHALPKSKQSSRKTTCAIKAKAAHAAVAINLGQFQFNLGWMQKVRWYITCYGKITYMTPHKITRARTAGHPMEHHQRLCALYMAKLCMPDHLHLQTVKATSLIASRKYLRKSLFMHLSLEFLNMFLPCQIFFSI